MKTGRPPAITYEMGGHKFTVRQLAELAGCSVQTLGKRLERGTSPAQAVAMGKADRHRYGQRAEKHPTAKVYTVAGEQLTVLQLA